MDPKRITAQLKERGWAYIEGVSLEEPDKALEEIVSSFSKPVKHLDQPLVMDLKPALGAQPASYAGTGEFDLHTDLSWFEKPPKYIAMLCITHDSAGGGIPIISDGRQALQAVSEKEARVLKKLRIHFPAPSHVKLAGHTGPVATQERGSVSFRFRADLLKGKMPAAVARFFEAAKNNSFTLDVKPGSVFIIDNHRMLHGRTEILGGLESERHFKRMYGN
jgi:alpha-ketoglutarate-dependent taurine dioxygenase